MSDPWADERKHINRFTEHPMRHLLADADALLAVKEAAEEAKRLLSAITASFPDGKPPHPSIEECMNIEGDLTRTLAALPEHLR